ncbi:DUF1707 SHOCT-like domain-containing protein [Parasphingorhabdus pacifica]
MASSENPSMRAADADREAVAERLRDALGEGRITLTEYDERLQRAYAAVTLADLAVLTTDLPAPAPAPTAGQGGSAEVRKSEARAVAKKWREWSSAAFVLVAIWLLTSIAAGGPLFFWPILPLGIWAMVLAAESIFGDEPGDS